MEHEKTKAISTKSEFFLPPEVLDDLSSRFIINVPKGEKRDLIRILFQIELAHWFYIDFYCKNQLSNMLKMCSLREFALCIFKHIPFLKPYVSELDRIIDEWKDYKYSVPTYGGILLCEDLSHVLLVQSYWSKSSWGFPKGKVNKDESPWNCAIREVYEETGFNISHLIDRNKYIEAHVHDQLVRLYIIQGVSRNIAFHPRTRNEIKSVNWFRINDLPASRRDSLLKLKTGLSGSSFYMVMPFMKELKNWVFEQSKYPYQIIKRNRYKSCSDIEGVFSSLSNTDSSEQLPIRVNKVRYLFNSGRRNQPSVSFQERYKIEYNVGRTTVANDSGVRDSLVVTNKVEHFTLMTNSNGQKVMKSNSRRAVGNRRKSYSPAEDNMGNTNDFVEYKFILQRSEQSHFSSDVRNLSVLKRSDTSRKTRCEEIFPDDNSTSIFFGINIAELDMSKESLYSSGSFLSDKNMLYFALYIAKSLYTSKFEFDCDNKKLLLRTVQKILTSVQDKLDFPSWVKEVLEVLDRIVEPETVDYQEPSSLHDLCKTYQTCSSCGSESTIDLGQIQSLISPAEIPKAKSWKNFKFDMARILEAIDNS